MCEVHEIFEKLIFKCTTDIIKCKALKDRVIGHIMINIDYEDILNEIASGLDKDINNIINDLIILHDIHKKNNYDIQYFKNDFYNKFKDKHYNRENRLYHFQIYLTEIFNHDPMDRSIISHMRITEPMDDDDYSNFN